MLIHWLHKHQPTILYKEEPTAGNFPWGTWATCFKGSRRGQRVGRKRSGDDFPLVATSAAIITTTAAACVIHGYDWQNLDYDFYWNSSPTIPLQNTHTHTQNKQISKAIQTRMSKCQRKTEFVCKKKQGNHLCYISWKFSFQALKSDAGRQTC